MKNEAQVLEAIKDCERLLKPDQFSLHSDETLHGMIAAYKDTLEE